MNWTMNSEYSSNLHTEENNSQRKINGFLLILLHEDNYVASTSLENCRWLPIIKKETLQNPISEWVTRLFLGLPSEN